MNLVPKPLLLQPLIQLPYILMREVFINRIWRQTVGYWGPQLQGVDYLSDKEIGAGLSYYLKLSENEIADAVNLMADKGDLELAARFVGWALTQYPDSENLKQARTHAFLQLKQKWQQLNPFKFVMYSELVDNPSPLAGKLARSDSTQVRNGMMTRPMPAKFEFAFNCVSDPGTPKKQQHRLKDALQMSGTNKFIFPPIGPGGGNAVKNDTGSAVTAVQVEILPTDDPRLPAGFAQPDVIWGDVDCDGIAGSSNVYGKITISANGKTIFFEGGSIRDGDFFQGTIPKFDRDVKFSAEATFTFS